MSGSKEFVKGELRDAINVLSQAEDVLDRFDRPIVSVQANGHAYGDPNGDCNFSGSFTVGGQVPAIPAPPPVEPAQDAVSASDITF